MRNRYIFVQAVLRTYPQLRDFVTQSRACSHDYAIFSIQAVLRTCPQLRDFVTQSWARSHTQRFGKRASQISSMLTLPARTLPTRKRKPRRKLRGIFSFVFYNTLMYISMLFRTLPCSFVLRRSLRFGTFLSFSFVTIPECRFLYFDS